MARYVQDREDLMREATALVRRVELQLPATSSHELSTTCVVGFRSGGEASLFVGADPVIQFNTAGELRRAFWNGRPLKAEAGRLVQLERRPASGEIHLVRHPLTDVQTDEFLRMVSDTLNRLQHAVEANDLVIRERVPADLDACRELTSWLAALPRPLRIATAPNVRTS